MLPDIWRRPWLGSNSLFEEMDREFAEAEDMLSRMFRTVHDIAPSTGTLTEFPYYYGYQITVGPDGKPRIREFGNVKPAAKGLVEQRGVRQPLVDSVLDEKENTLRITAEMPGINKEDIKLNVTDQYVTIHAEKGDKKYHADIPVSVELDESSAKASYTNGILELKIKPKETSKVKGKAIKIE
ncbi:MAG TPA: archaeal heat shock protein Hsp20 [Candidatus Bathyarchaeia archaeon]|nr:archaeal heat shock protein Hsp20 [Candidatus Bathyarchaeia archaeon]